MRYVFQAVCAVAIVVGSGFSAFGHYVEPRMNPGALYAVHAFNIDSGLHEFASIARGVGAGLVALGGCGLVIPWANSIAWPRSDRSIFAVTKLTKVA